MAEAATIIALISSGVIKLKDPCSFPDCKLSPTFECPLCKSTYCPKHASSIDFECEKCHRKLIVIRTIPIEL